jgi:hypothetical protein
MVVAAENRAKPPWAHLPIHVPDQVKAFFAVAIISEVGDGEHTLFWADR